MVACQDSGKEKLTINFVGDLMSTYWLHLPNPTNSLPKLNYMLKDVKAELTNADLTVGNLESPVSGSFPSGRFPRFNAPVHYLDALTNVGFDILSYANNHTCDMGFVGVEDTMFNILDRGMRCVGVGFERSERILYVSNTYNLAFIAWTYGMNGHTNGIEMVNCTDRYFKYRKRIIDDIRSVPSNFTTVLMLHWGQEYHTNYDPWQRELAKEFVSNGVDLIVGTHPHVLQPVETITNGGNVGIVAYSLGNFIGTKRKLGATKGKILRIAITEDGVSVEREIPTYISREGVPGDRYYAIRTNENVIKCVASGKRE